MQKTKIFNPNGNDNEKNIINGNSTNLIDLTNLKYPWAKNIYKSCLNCFWIPEKIDLSGDDILLLTEDEKKEILNDCIREELIEIITIANRNIEIGRAHV